MFWSWWVTSLSLFFARFCVVAFCLISILTSFRQKPRSDDRVRTFCMSRVCRESESVGLVCLWSIFFGSCLPARGVLGRLVPRELWETSGFWFSREFWDLFHLTSHRRCRIMWFVMPPSISDSFQICSHQRFQCGCNLAALQAELQPWVRMHGRAADTELAFL